MIRMIIILLLPCFSRNYSQERGIIVFEGELFRLPHGNRRIIVLSYGKSLAFECNIFSTSNLPFDSS